MVRPATLTPRWVEPDRIGVAVKQNRLFGARNQGFLASDMVG